MKKTQAAVVTTREALSLFGMRRTSLRHLERAAKIARLPGRIGYSSEEMRRLFRAARKAINKESS